MTTTPQPGPAAWIAGARPRTLPAAIAPVLAGTGVAAYEHGAIWWKALLAAGVSLALQIGVNYANDYSDGIRGTDDVRVGPLRLVGSGLASPQAVKTAALGFLGLGAALGLILAATTSWWLVAVGAVALVAAWTYTGGPKPYGYHGLGEVSVFVFFGLVAVVGTTYVQLERTPDAAWTAGVGIGALACALLVVNNLRDIPTDVASGKKTLATKLGDRGTRNFFLFLLLIAIINAVTLILFTPWAALTVVALPHLTLAARRVHGGATGRDLIPVLQWVGVAEFLYALGLIAGLSIAA